MKIDAAFQRLNTNQIFVFSGDEYYRISPQNPGKIEPGYPKKIQQGWPGVGFSHIDAIFQNRGNGKVFMFCGAEYIRFDLEGADKADAGYPKSIKGNWPGVEFAKIDAAFQRRDNGKIFLFSGNEYIRFDLEGADKAEPGYPKPIKGNWPGVGFSQVDAVFQRRDNGKVYLLSGNEYIRFDLEGADKAEPGYPRQLPDNWPELLKLMVH